jgi:GxxExxY protein
MLLYKEECYKIIGACMEVHNTLGCGFLEAVYQEALAIEFDKRGIPYVREPELNIEYKGIVLSKKYNADFICYDKIIIESKALSELLTVHQSQVINYLKITKFKLGILVNFGEENLNYIRLANSK